MLTRYVRRWSAGEGSNQMSFKRHRSCGFPYLFLIVHKRAGREGTHHAATCTWARKDNPGPGEP